MKQNISCITYKGDGNYLIKYKEATKELCKNMNSFVRVSTCQRIEIYADAQLSGIKGMKSLDYPDSMQHLIEVLSGIDSGLFGEMEICLQIKEAVKAAVRENHFSTNLKRCFILAFKISEMIRSKFSLNNSWISSIEKIISDKKNIFVYGDGKLASLLYKTLSRKNFNLLDNQNNADVIIILKKGFVSSRNSNHAKIINLTEEEFKEDEIRMNEFFVEPENKDIYSLKERIKNELLVLSKPMSSPKKEKAAFYK